MSDKCWNINSVESGVELFADEYRRTGDFFQSSVTSVKHLNKRGIDITKGEFDLIVRDNFTSIVTRDYNATGFERPSLSTKIKKINKLLGITNNGLTYKKGKYVTGKVSIKAQEQLGRIREALITNNNEGLTVFEKTMVESIKEGKNYSNPDVLEQVVTSLDQIYADGVADLDTILKENQERKAKEAADVAEDVSRLNKDQQEVRNLADKIYKEGAQEGEVDRLVGLLKDKFGKTLNADNFKSDKEAASAAVWLINRETTHPLGKGVLSKFSKGWNKFFNFAFNDVGSIEEIISKQGGRTHQLVGDRLRRSAYKITGETDHQLNDLATKLLIAQGKEIKKFKGTKGVVKDAEYLLEQLKDYAIESATQFKNTGVVLPGGIPFEPTKGELQQLYVDALDPRLAESMENAGLSLSDLDTLVSKHLSDADKQVAFTVMEFYREQYQRENEVYKSQYGTNMPFNANYAGPASYQSDSKEDTRMTSETMNNRKQVNASLGNAIERQGTSKKLRLDRNLIVNVTNRINNSAKFIGGSQTYSDITYILDNANVSAELKAAHNVDYRAELKKRMDVQFGFDNYGPSFAALNYIKGAMTRTALALKPKLFFNQAVSSTNWLIEGETWDGLIKGRHADLKDVNISKALYDLSPWLKDRYKSSNIIALDAQIESASYEAESMFGDLKQGKLNSKIGKVDKRLSKLDMLPTLAGDNIGIMAFGVQYFKGHYSKSRDAGLSHQEAMDEAAYQFAKKAATTQQSYESIDRAPIQQSLLSVFTMFQTTPLQYGRITINSARDLIRNVKDEGVKGIVKKGDKAQRSPLKNVANMFVYHFFSGFMYHTVMQGVPAMILGTYDSEDFEEALTSGAYGPYLASIFFFGDIIDFAYGWYTGAVFESEVGKSAAFQNINKALKNFKKLTKLYAKSDLTSKEEEKIEELKFDVVASILALRGLAIKRYGEVYDVIDHVVSGDGDIKDLLIAIGYSEWTIDQQLENEKKGESSLFGNSNDVNLFDEESVDIFGGDDVNIFD